MTDETTPMLKEMENLSETLQKLSEKPPGVSGLYGKHAINDPLWDLTLVHTETGPDDWYSLQAYIQEFFEREAFPFNVDDYRTMLHDDIKKALNLHGELSKRNFHGEVSRQILNRIDKDDRLIKAGERIIQLGVIQSHDVKKSVLIVKGITVQMVSSMLSKEDFINRMTEKYPLYKMIEYITYSCITTVAIVLEEMASNYQPISAVMLNEKGEKQ